jgi:hypothetical protein
MRRLLQTLRSHLKRASLLGEYQYLRQVMSELITFTMKRSASALREQFFMAVRRRFEGHRFGSDRLSGAGNQMPMAPGLG